MAACVPSNSVACDYTASSLGGISLVLPQVGDDFPFRAFIAGNNVQIDQTATGIVVSIIQNRPRVYLGITPLSAQLNLQNIPLTFTTTPPGSINTGIYSAGTTTIAVPGIYHISAQVSTRSNGIPTDEFVRKISVLINGVPLLFVVSCKTSFSGFIMTTNLSIMHPLLAADVVTFEFIVGSLGLATYDILPNGFMSISLM
jgi:hypothetical protein